METMSFDGYHVTAYELGPEWPGRKTIIPDDGFTHLLHFFGEMDLPYPASRDQCWQEANEIAEACGYSAQKVGLRGLGIAGQYEGQMLLVFNTQYVTGKLVQVFDELGLIAIKRMELECEAMIARLEDLEELARKMFEPSNDAGGVIVARHHARKARELVEEARFALRADLESNDSYRKTRK